MIPALIHMRFSGLCVYSRTTQGPTPRHLYHSANNSGRLDHSSTVCSFKARMKSIFFSTQTASWLGRFIKTLTQNIKTELRRERRGVSQRRAIKTARSGLLCVVVLCVSLCVCVLFWKKRYRYTDGGPPATRVRALLGWRPGTDLRVCLKCRLQILCTKSLQEYSWPLESFSGFFSAPAIAPHLSLRYSGLTTDRKQGWTC